MSRFEYANNFQPIVDGSAAVGVPIHESLIQDARESRRTEYDFVFSPCHVAFTKAAKLLRTQRKPQLTAEPHINGLLPSYLAEDTTGEQFIDLFNSAAGDEYSCPDDVQFGFQPVEDANVCGFAEIGFAETAADMVRKAEEMAEVGEVEDGQGYVLFTGDDDRPVLLRKTNGIPTALTFEPIMINGAVFPAGSIVRATTRKEDYLKHVPMDVNFSIGKTNLVQAVPVREISNIGVLRLSLFAASEKERGDLASNFLTDWLETYKSNGSAEVLDTFHLAEARQTALQALAVLDSRADAEY